MPRRIFRVEIVRKADTRGNFVTGSFHTFGLVGVEDVAVSEIYYIVGSLSLVDAESVAKKLLCDPVTEEYHIDGADEETEGLEILYNAGVTDPKEASVKKALADLQGLNAQLDRFSLEARDRDPQAIQLAVKIFEIDEQIYLNDMSLLLNHLQDRIEDLSTVPGQELPIPELDRHLASVESIRLNLKNIRLRIAAKQDLIAKKIEVIQKSKTQNVITHYEFANNLKIGIN